MRTTTFLLAALGCAASANAAVTFDWAAVGNPGNAADPETGHGAVDYTYRISKYEVTNAQYTQFLNAVDPAGMNSLSLYNSFMSTEAQGGINFDAGAPNGSKYEIKSGRENNPVAPVSFFNAMRFVNWLENGQGSGDTESGVYTIGNGTDEARNPNATYFIPSKDEWYKAAYHKNDGVTGNYWDYPTSTDAIPYSDNPSSLNTPDNSNVANFYRDDSIANGYNGGYAVTDSTIDDDGQNHLTDVGAYPLAASPYDTFDQGGNVWEWTEEVSADPGRELRGGGWSSTGSLGLAYLQLSATRRITALPEYHGRYGFRVASIPEPSTALCAALASVTLFIRRRAKHQKLRPVSL